MTNVNEKTINDILDTMKSLIEKAQIVQGPPSSSGNLATQTNAEVYQDLETRVGAGAVDYVPTPPGVGDPAQGMGGVKKAQDEDEEEAEEEEEDDEDEDEEEDEEEDDKKKKEEETKKSLLKARGRKMKVYDKEEEEVPLRSKKDLEKTCMKSSPQYDYDYEEVLPVDNVILEVTRCVDSALKSLATRVDFFMKALGAHQYEMMKSLSGILAITSEGLAKSFDVVQEEAHAPERGPKSAMTPDVQKSQEATSYTKDQVTNMMFKSIQDGSKIIKNEDVIMLETSGVIRQEVKKELGIE